MKYYIAFVLIVVSAHLSGCAFFGRMKTTDEVYPIPAGEAWRIRVKAIETQVQLISDCLNDAKTRGKLDDNWGNCLEY